MSLADASSSRPRRETAATLLTERHPVEIVGFLSDTEAMEDIRRGHAVRALDSDDPRLAALLTRQQATTINGSQPAPTSRISKNASRSTSSDGRDGGHGAIAVGRA